MLPLLLFFLFPYFETFTAEAAGLVQRSAGRFGRHRLCRSAQSLERVGLQ